VRNPSLPTESESLASALAVSRYGVNQRHVQSAEQALAEARAQGKNADLLDMLVGRRLLTPGQADELRRDLKRSNLDSTLLGPAPLPQSPVPAPAKAGGARPAPKASPQRLRTLGEFRLLRRLGEGGMGAVYLGYQEGQARQVAIKVLAEQLTKNQAYIDRFQREAKSGLVLDHPNIVRCMAAGQDQASGKHYLVLEFVDGPSARALLERFGRLAVGDAVHIALDIARALEHIHSRNFVHRDIKPDNILVTRSGMAKLGDLGLAKRIDDSSNLTAARQGVGTPYYMPYEQVINAKQVDGRCDIYALGATLYHLLTGEVPFPGKSALEIAEKKLEGTLPAALDRILEKMMALFPHERYQTASELIVDLERANLAAPVPSFVDADVALRDPLVRARLTAPAQATVADVDAAQQKAAAANGHAPLWHLRCRGKDGQWRKAKATTKQIVGRLHDGRLPRGTEASRGPEGKFRPLAAYPEFRSRRAAAPAAPEQVKAHKASPAPDSEATADLPDAVPARGEGHVRLLLALGIGLSFLALVSGIVYILLNR
jgi:serine/threonine-protein kinase